MCYICSDYIIIAPTMKRIFIITVTFITLLLSSCQEREYSIEYFPYRIEKSDFWGMMSPDGTPLFDGKFMYPPSIATRGVFMAREEAGLYTFYTAEENPRRINNELYVAAKPFLLSDYTPVVQEGHSHITIINKQGVCVATLPQNIIDVGLFSSGLAPFATDSIAPRMGYINTRGEVVIEPRYSIATNFVDGVALVEEIIKGIPSVMVINTQGKVIYTFGNEWQPLATEYSDGLLPVINIRHEIGFLDTRGRMAIAPSDEWQMCLPDNQATIPYTFKNGYCIFSDGIHYGLMNKRGKIVVPAQYRNLYLGEGGLFAAENEAGDWGCINSRGEIVIPFEHFPGVIRPSVTPSTIVMQNEMQRYRLINEKGKVISKPFTNYQTK